MDYKSQLSHPLWQRKRLEVMKRDKFSCKCCGNKNKTLDVHHKCYFEHLLAWEYSDDLLVTLCRTCHEKEGLSPQMYKALATALQLTGFLYSDVLCFTTMLYDKKFSNNIIKKLRKMQTPLKTLNA